MILIGADGGATKTALAAYRDGVLLSQAIVGPINYYVIGVSAAVDNFLQGVRALNVDLHHVGAIGIGDPAIDDTAPTDPDSPTGQWLRQLREALGVPVYLRSDAYMTLFSLTGGGTPAVLMLSGTGAMGIAETAAGEILVAGGWGRISDDEGSGYYIAIEGIRAALRAHDGVRPATALTDALCRHFGAATPRALIDVFYANPAPDLAAFARVVDDCAQQGDAVAIAILKHAAAYLAAYTSRLLHRSGARLVGVFGSVLCRNRTVREEYERLLRREFAELTITEPPCPPQAAAARYAQLCLEKEQHA